MFKLLRLLLFCFALSSSEPVCSRFHYEEQTLKKMITVELLVDKLKAEVEGTVNNVNEVLAEIKAERRTSEHVLSQLQEKVEKDAERSIKQVNETLNEALEGLEMEKENKAKALKELKDSMATKVLFSARSLKNLTPIKGETLVFTITMTNLGSGYDNTTGIFTAPVEGVFLFIAQICVANNKHIFVEIVADDIPLLKDLRSDDYGSYHACNTASISVFLTVGQRVWLKTGDADSNALFENTVAWNIFNGVLIHT